MKKYIKTTRCALGVISISFTLASDLMAAKPRKGDDGSGGGIREIRAGQDSGGGLKLEGKFDQLALTTLSGGGGGPKGIKSTGGGGPGPRSTRDV
ncbi:MAG: hypothetical protein HOE90_08645 [Bacteriovoracaceae bacterium]|nr:hypothetical protein [Bacteriovoracaceae bacterium]